MTWTSNNRWRWALLLILSSPLVLQAQSIEAITKPSGDVNLAFVQPGRIFKVFVKKGQSVKAGESLIQQDDRAERIEFEKQKADADDLTRVKAAQAQLEQKKLDLVKFEDAFKKGASPEMEVERARLDVKIAEFQLQVEQFQREQDRRKQNQLQVQLDRMLLKSPITGHVEDLNISEGEANDANNGNDTRAKLIRVVSIDPLWIDVPVSLSQSEKLQAARNNHQEPVIDVLFNGGPASATRPEPVVTAKGKIIAMAAVADGASMTRIVRLEVPNPTSRPAGEHVEIRFQEAPPAAAAAQAKTNQVAGAAK